jgi:hypothetical protein
MKHIRVYAASLLIIGIITQAKIAPPLEAKCTKAKQPKGLIAQAQAKSDSPDGKKKKRGRPRHKKQAAETNEKTDDQSVSKS